MYEPTSTGFRRNGTSESVAVRLGRAEQRWSAASVAECRARAQCRLRWTQAIPARETPSWRTVPSAEISEGDTVAAPRRTCASRRARARLGYNRRSGNRRGTRVERRRSATSRSSTPRTPPDHLSTSSRSPVRRAPPATTARTATNGTNGQPTARRARRRHRCRRASRALRATRARLGPDTLVDHDHTKQAVGGLEVAEGQQEAQGVGQRQLPARQRSLRGLA